MYWRDDKAFYPAEIMGYDTATGRHEVEYDDSKHLKPSYLSISFHERSTLAPQCCL